MHLCNKNVRYLLHSADVLSLFFLSIFVFVDIACPIISSHPPPFPSSSPLFPINIPMPPPSVCQSLDRFDSSLFITTIPKRPHSLMYPKPRNFTLSLILLLAGDIHLNPGPVTLNFANLNTRSVSSITNAINKPALLQDFITDQDIDIISLTETWLSIDSLPSTLNSLTPPNFSIISNPRTTGRGGGIAFIFRSHLNISKFTVPNFSSFESLCIKLSISSKSYTFLSIYRSPNSKEPFSEFLTDFHTLTDHLNTFPSELIISGDFNIHVDNPTLPECSSFSTVLDCTDLVQHVHFPTHKLGHTLDLLLSRSSSSLISNVEWTIPFISDHYAIHATLSIPSASRLPRITKLVRSFSKIDTNSLSSDILRSELHSTHPSSLDTYLLLFTSTLTSLLDKHAPLKSVTYCQRTTQPFFTPTIRAAKSIRSKLETVYRNSNLKSDLNAFKNQSHALAKLITSSRRSYFRSLISNHKGKPRKLWSTLNSLLSRKCPPILPTTSNSLDLATSFLSFFNDKIAKFSKAFSFNSTTYSYPHLSPQNIPPSFDRFSPATTNEVQAAILSSSDSTCSLDSIPTTILKSCLPSLLLPITTLVNLSLDENKFPDSYKHALVKPLLKKFNLPPNDLTSYRPISNLNFISKIIERIIHNRLCTHLNSFPSLTPFQSAYRRLHSTETALLRIQNDLLQSVNNKKVSALILLDLSAAFDTIDHQILLTRLSSYFGITGSALSLISSYLSNRTQSVLINDSFTPSSPVTTGVPQGSVLGPLLFSLYTSPLSEIFVNSPVSYHLYADDTQLYISFSPSQANPNLDILSSTLESVHNWLTSNRLTVNPSKTEYLLIGTPQQRSKISNSSVHLKGINISPSDSARNLGFIFDSNLSHKSQISSVCKTSFLQIRQLRQIRSSLDISSAIVLANSLVSSRLDYCNSLYYNLPESSIHRLQRVQNSLARVVLPYIKRRHHITPALQKLHWLPIKDRITFKIATLTFKTIQTKLPSYLYELIIPHNPTRPLRHHHQNQLVCPLTKSENGRRSFSYAAPTVWNSLPVYIRSIQSLDTFRSKLKTYLFPPLPT